MKLVHAGNVTGGHVERSAAREFGRARLEITSPGPLLGNLPATTTVWMSHGDQVTGLDADQFEVLASTPSCRFAAVRHRSLPSLGRTRRRKKKRSPLGPK